MAEFDVTIHEILAALEHRPEGTGPHQPPSSFTSIYGLISSLERCSISLMIFQRFVSSIKSIFISGDSTKRSLILRAVRLCIQSSSYVKALIAEELHWLIVESLEKDADYTMERIQAIKLMDKVRKVDADNYPVAFGRSIISVANSKEDSFRKICVESLRDLALANPAFVASLYGFSTLIDVILEPITQELADNITLTLLYLLNDPVSRKVVEPCVDLRMLIAPFTDLDTEHSELLPKWNAAKSAFLLIMKSWVGIIHLVSDDHALGMLIRMLKDPKVPFHIQDLMLDMLEDVFSTACFKASYSTRRHRHEFSVSLQPMSTTPTPTKDLSAELVGIRQTRAISDTEMFRESSQSSPGNIQSGGMGSGSSDVGHISSNGHSSRTRASFSLAGSLFSSGNMLSRHSLSDQNNETSTPTSSQNHYSNAPRPSSISSYLFGSARTTSPATVGKNVATKRTSITTSSSYGNLAKTSDAIQSTPSKSSAPPLTPLERIVEEDSPNNPPVHEIDPIFSLLDNFSALLCCGFLHVDLICSLYVLSTDGRIQVATKSRKLLVNFLRILSDVLPETACADLLTNPTLIDLAASIGPSRSASKAHKSSKLLIDLAEAFSIMPLKQTSGAHASNLTTFATSSKPRNGSITNKSSNQINTTVAFNASPLQTRSNFLPLNIRTMFELAEEIKICTSSVTFNGLRRYDTSSSVLSSSNTRTLNVINSLRANLTPSIDKTDFSKQMEISKVVGKEGKEPFKWDWVAIGDMLEYSFLHPDRLTEALKTKWIRRVSGFYRCSVEEKGYFCNLEWDPTNLQYLECACNLYSVLLRDEAGISFLTSDRRGMLFNEMAQEIETLVTNAATKNWLGVSTSNATKNVFRLHSCNSFMARELFTLLGKIVKTPGSRKLLEYTNLFEHLSKLGQHKSLDYVTRLVITSLCFTDGGLLSRHLLQLWTTSPTSSQDFRHYLHNLLRIMIQTATLNESYHWSIDAVVNQLPLEDNPGFILYKAIEEAIHSRSNLKLIISKRPKLISDPDAQHILIRFAAVPEGIDFLNEKNWLEGALNQWITSKCKEYAIEVEKKLAAALSRSFESTMPDILKGVDPIPLKTPELVQEIIARQGPSSAVASNNNTNDPNQAASKSNDPNSNLRVDLQGFLRVPWNIELKVVNLNFQQDPITSNGDYLRIDSFLDTSDISSPQNYDITSDQNRIVKVRGIVLDSKGNPCGHPIAQNKVIVNTLLAGICPVSRTGEVQSSFEFQPPQRRRASTTTHREETRSAGRSSFVGGTVPVPGSISSTSVSDQVSNNESDLPITVGQEYWYNWSICKPGHRQGSTVELEDGMFAVSVAGEPVVWIFSRRPTNATGSALQRPSRAGSLSNLSITKQLMEQTESLFEKGRSNRMDTSRSGGILYLVEVHYYFRIQTGQGVFVPIPRHLYGELSRTLEGCAHLARKSIVYELVSNSRQIYDGLAKHLVANTIAPPGQLAAQAAALSSGQATLELRGNLWALGHLASTEYGYNAITNVDPNFVEWCIEGACQCAYFNIRGTFFYVLGLISKTPKGNQKLHQCRWDSTALNCNSAVTIPRNVHILFQRISSQTDNGQNIGLKKSKFSGGKHNHTRAGLPYLSLSNMPSSIKLLTPFIPSGSVSAELEILNLIAKMPGVILYRESKNRLEALKRDRPEIFNKHSLYVDVHRILESYNFKLTARKDILNLFTEAARVKPNLPTNNSFSNQPEVKAPIPIPPADNKIAEDVVSTAISNSNPPQPIAVEQ